MANVSGAEARPGSRSRGTILDGILLILALAFGAVSLSYPFGHDQGLYEYVAREWVQRGAIPYRDVFDHKTPGIYILYGATIVLFGSNEWGIRVADLAGVVVLGLLVARLTTGRFQPIKRGLRGLAVLVSSVVYYGFFDFWNSAQSELWYGLLGLASVTAAARARRGPRAQVLAGILAGAALVMKPTSAPFVAIAVVILILREREDAGPWWPRTALALARFAGGAAAVFAIVLGYFGAHHAIGPMVDIVVGANGFYVSHEKGVRTLSEVFARTYDFYRDEAPLTVFLVYAVLLVAFLSIAERPHRLPPRYVLAASACLAGYAAVTVQQKFYFLHWGAMVAPFALLTTTILADLVAAASRSVRPVVALALVAAGFLGLYASSPIAFPKWSGAVEREISFLTNTISRDEYARSFTVPDRYYYYGDIVKVSDYIREHSSTDDTICVRGFNPEVYILTGRHYGGRFFWSNFLVFPERAYRRDAYLAEDALAFSNSRPRFVVTHTEMHDGLESSEYYSSRGYHVVATFDKLEVLERGEP